jgi:hypothetical protein
MVALARRAREGGSWLVRISLAQTGRWLVGLGEVPESALKDVPTEFSAAEIDHWSIESEAPAGRLCTCRRPRLTGLAPRSRSATTSLSGPPALPKDPSPGTAHRGMSLPDN